MRTILLTAVFALTSSAFAGPTKLVVLEKGDIKQASVEVESREIQYKGEWKTDPKGKICTGKKACTATLKVKYTYHVNEYAFPRTQDHSSVGRASGELFSDADAQALRATDLGESIEEHLAFLHSVNAGTKHIGKHCTEWTVGGCTEVYLYEYVNQIRIYVDTASGKVTKAGVFERRLRWL